MNNIDLPSNLEELDALDQALDNADLDHMEQMEPSEPEDLMTDAEADADVLASCGWGTDEDYGSDFCGSEE